jgi:hypothetical protein
MKIGWPSLCVKEIAISSRVIDPVQFSLPAVQICLSQRPGLGHGKSIQMVSDLNELVVCVLEAFIDLALSKILVSIVINRQELRHTSLRQFRRTSDSDSAVEPPNLAPFLSRRHRQEVCHPSW